MKKAILENMQLMLERRYISTTLKNIDIYLERGLLDIQTEDREDIYVGYYLSNKDREKSFTYKSSIVGQTLHVQLKRKNLFVPFNFFDGLVLKIRIPKYYRENINIATATGQIFVTQQQAHFNECVVKSTTGNISLLEVDANQLTVTSTTGNIQVKVPLSQEFDNDRFKIKTTAGKVVIDAMNLYHKMYVKSVTGDIVLGIDSQLTNYDIHFKSVSGRTPATSIKTASSEACQIYANTVAGNILFEKN
ncbi:DUF4097 family beta strand repeat-containing protein [Bacillus sp. DX1.1]|uniref:DUF4097 family beta strand repeat-containing protein n=1 Tax=unclassified Bacillus (in: firmicutes) TaxID=185979 RepID=UPI002570157F|nr:MULTISPECIES: DUF4097 family beta strand repeat-containing protein [unclassified Bacillus (in: firmicutes)]MDM5153502.1 DUF4097 family beta strand repeat-containing protein [Bacillus sp. DX1.1]WJE82455.1 DUF4097 family beta strand repeat-containing protein [Bacillus sp. DX3.1]